MNKQQHIRPSGDSSKKGQALSEYLILTALIGVASIAVIQTLSGNLRKNLGEVSAALGGEKKELQAIKVEEKHYKVYDLGDFNDGMQDNSER